MQKQVFHGILICLLFFCAPLVNADNTVSEVRGVWITNVDSDMLFSHAKLVESIDYLARTGFNVIYPVVWNKGMTLFPSHIMDSIFGIPQDTFFAQQGRDPLAELIVEAHRHGMEVIPWFEFGFSSSYNENGGHIIAKKPQWAALDKDGRLLKKNGFEWMDALNREVQDFVLSLLMELVTNYDIDGIQGDDRLPAMPVEGGYSPAAKELYRRDHGGVEPPSNPRDMGFVRWKATQLNHFTARMYRMIKAADANLIVSMAPNMYSWAYLEYLQDSRTWLDSVYCDQYIPQVYRWQIADYKELTLNIFGDTGRMEYGFLNHYWKQRSIPGIIIKAGNQYSDQNYVLEAVRYNRSLGIAGESFFFYEGLGKLNNFLADTLHKYVYQKPALPFYRHGYLWRPEARILQAEDNGNQREGEWRADANLKGYQNSPTLVTSDSNAKLSFTIDARDAGLYDIFYYVPRGMEGKKESVAQRIKIDSQPMSFSSSVSVWGWQSIGVINLKAGKQIIDFTFMGSSENPLYIDAIMLMVNRRHARQTVVNP